MFVRVLGSDSWGLRPGSSSTLCGRFWHCSSTPSLSFLSVKWGQHQHLLHRKRDYCGVVCVCVHVRV